MELSADFSDLGATLVRTTTFYRSLLLAVAFSSLPDRIRPAFAEAPRDKSEVIRRIQTDQTLRIGMYLGFEGLSFRERGKLVGLEVELASLLADEFSAEIGSPVRPEIVNQEWSQIIKVLRDEKYDLVMSAVIPSSLYQRYHIRYSPSYLDTGPTICCREVDGKPTPGITSDIRSLEGKRIVVINDPAVRRTLRVSGVYVESDRNETDLERSFPQAATEALMAENGIQTSLISVKGVVQMDEMPHIYELIASGAVDAGVIDMGIIWWVSNNSKRWANRIYAFSKPIGPYIYCITTREEDVELGNLLDIAVGRMLANPKYHSTIEKWHSPQAIDWDLEAADFLHPPRKNRLENGFSTMEPKR